jgi:hypothetical protein
MFHFQNDVDNWPDAVALLPNNSCVKAVDRADILRTTKGINSSIFTILRHWDDSLQHFDGNTDWEVLKERARHWFSTHIDGTFLQNYVETTDAVSWYNEIWAYQLDGSGSQSPAEIQERIRSTEAAVYVWETEYKPKFGGKDIKLVIGEAAVGNDMPRRIAELAIESGNIVGYHPYSLWENKVRNPGDFQWISGRYDAMEKTWGLKPTWAFTESGPFNNVLDGWRSSNCLGGDVNLYIEAMRTWIREMGQTAAYKENRILGFTLFTSGGGEKWKRYETRQPEMNMLANMIREEWVSDATPPDPPPDPPDPPLPPDDDNLLKNASFEGPATQNGDVQVPIEWSWWNADSSTTNPHDPNPWSEFVTPDSFVEENSMAIDGVKVTRITKNNGAWYARLSQPVSLQPGKYFFTTNIFANLVKGFNEDESPIWADDPEGRDGMILLATPPDTFGWISLKAGTWNNISAQFDHDGTPGEVALEMMLPFALPVNELILDKFSVTLVSEPPPEDETLEEHLWRVGIENQAIELNPEAALQEQIFYDGFVPVMAEYWTTYDGVQYAVQAAERLDDGQRRTYFARVPDWGNIMYITEPDQSDPEVEIIDIVDDLPKHDRLQYGSRPLSGIEILTIHHSASLASPTAIATYHVDTKGWPGIGYHFLIMPDGTIYQTNKLTTLSYHAGSARAPGDENYFSVGICLNGNFTDDPPPQAQLDAARLLVDYLQEFLGEKEIVPHGSMPGAQTQCPGNTQDQWLGYIRGE